MSQQSTSLDLELETVNKARALTDQEDDPFKKLSLQQMIMALHTSRIADLTGKMKGESQGVNDKKKNLEFFQALLRKINTNTDDSGKIDLSKDSELKTMLQEAKEKGIDVPTKDKLSAQERNALRENVNSKAEELNLSINMQMESISSFHKEWDQSFMILKNTMATIKKAGDTMIHGIKGN